MGKWLIQILNFCAVGITLLALMGQVQAQILEGRNRHFDFEQLSIAERLDWQDWHQRVQPGDIILAPLYCWSCFYIEDETGFPFSHSAVVLDITSRGEVLLGEALGVVRTILLRDWIRPLRDDSPWIVVRPDFEPSISDLDKDQRGQYFRQRFDLHFSHLSFDGDFLWGNHDERGERLLYCSEFVFEFLDPYLLNRLHTFPMDYSRNWDYWQSYFSIPVPQGRRGFSPGDFLRFDGMEVVLWH